MHIQRLLVFVFITTTNGSRFRNTATSIKSFFGSKSPALPTPAPRGQNSLVIPPVLPIGKSSKMARAVDTAKVVGQTGMGFAGAGTLITSISALFGFHGNSASSTPSIEVRPDSIIIIAERKSSNQSNMYFRKL